MKTRFLRKTMAVAFVSAFAAYSVQASAISLSFNQNSGFIVDSTLLSNGSAGSQNDDIVWYKSSTDAPVAPGAPSSGGQTFGTIAWGLPSLNNGGLTTTDPFIVVSPPPGTLASDVDYSGLRVIGLSGSITEAWTPITTIIHQNRIISGSASVLSAAGIYSDLTLGLGSNQNTVNITAFAETPNVTDGCPAFNPVGTTCDDLFTFDFSGFNPVVYDDGFVRYLVQFTLGSPVNAYTDFPDCPDGKCSLYTGEGRTGQISVLARISEIPEPGTLALFSLGLLGLAGLKKRAKADAE